MTGVPHTNREALAGTRMILRYNWPLYLAGVVTAMAGTAVARSGKAPARLRLAGGTAAATAGWLSIASVAASWWIYDHSELYRWSWLPRVVADPPRRVLVVHAGLDEASPAVQALWPQADVEPWDVHGGVGPTTASLARARATTTAKAPGGQPADTHVDLALAFLAAHELRRPAGRVAALAAVADRLRPGGRLVLVEHARDLANALVYGPAVGHFYAPGMWRREVRTAGLRLVDERSITPFVRLFAADKPT